MWAGVGHSSKVWTVTEVGDSDVVVVCSIDVEWVGVDFDEAVEAGTWSCETEELGLWSLAVVVDLGTDCVCADVSAGCGECVSVCGDSADLFGELVTDSPCVVSVADGNDVWVCVGSVVAVLWVCVSPDELAVTPCSVEVEC